MNEFQLIARYFTASRYRDDVLLGVGDDAAVVDVPSGYRLVTSVDTIVEGIHFPANSDAADIAYRALAVNLSDIAAMGAIPKWFTLSLCIPSVNEAWLSVFAKSLSALASQFDVELIGGDTVKGPLNISVQIMGIVEQDRWLTRSGARSGDIVFISGTPGEAAGGLQLLLHPELYPPKNNRDEDINYLIQRFLRPMPRVELGRLLRPFVSAAMDVSDGLLGDLRKLCAANRCGAKVHLEQLPRSESLTALFGAERGEQLTLSGGDDYELLFTIDPEHLSHVEQSVKACGIPCTAIGTMDETGELRCVRDNQPVTMIDSGYDHFAS